MSVHFAGSGDAFGSGGPLGTRSRSCVVRAHNARKASNGMLPSQFRRSRSRVIGLHGKPGCRGDAARRFPRASHRAGPQGGYCEAAQPPAGTRGLQPAWSGQPGITGQALFLAVLDQVDHRHTDYPAQPEPATHRTSL